MSEKPLSDELCGEVCQSCHCAYDTVYHVPDSIWARMLPDKAPGGLLCIPCAIRIAGEKGITLWWQGEVDDFPTTALERSNAERKDKLDAASDVISSQVATIAALRELIVEHMQGHRDPNDGGCYNECDTEPCEWCRKAEMLGCKAAGGT